MQWEDITAYYARAISYMSNMFIKSTTGPPCPKGMMSLLGQCFGIVQNSEGSNATDKNCFWKSGDKNYQLAVLTNTQVNVLVVHLIHTYLHTYILTYIH